jgi:hypothetical protein
MKFVHFSLLPREPHEEAFKFFSGITKEVVREQWNIEKGTATILHTCEHSARLHYALCAVVQYN